jgi:predicted ribosome quality control (RQC) complex YloA/Tae2 family protein
VLGLRELRRAARVLETRFASARVQAVVQPDDCSIVLELYTPEERRRQLVLCARPGLARVGLAPEAPRGLVPAPAFAQLLRARLAGARLEAAGLRHEDRQLALRFQGPEGAGELLLSVLGPRSNLYWIDAEGILRGALRPLESTRRTLRLGEPWHDPDTPPPSEGEDRFAAEPDAGLLEAIERAYAEREAERVEGELERRLGQALRKGEAALERKLRAVRADLESSAQAEELRRHGELLKSALSQVGPKASEVVAHDFETGEDVRIELDPSLSAAGNLERLFKRYHKALRRATAAGQQQGELEARRAELDALRAELDAAAGDAERLEALAAGDVARRLLGRYASVAAPSPERPRARGPHDDLPARLRPRRYRCESGLEVWVGRSDEGNDLLTTKLARGNDLFFHLEASPGSHVVLRTGGRKDPPPEAVLDACELAVHFSKQRNASRANVHVAPIRDVRKPKGAKPGLVQVTGGKTIALRRDPKRLERILASADDDPGS